MSNREQNGGDHPFHIEGENVIFDSPKERMENAEEVRAREQHEFQRVQVTSNKWIAWFNGLLVLATICATGIGVWQARISRAAANAATSAADTAAKTLEMDRPYLSIDVVPISDLEFTPEGRGYLRLGSTVVNYGRNPALNARIWV